MQDVVYIESTNSLVSIKGVAFSQLSVAVLCLFCVTHNISGYNNKKRSDTLLLIMLHARAMVVENTMCPVWDNDDGIHVCFGLSMHTNNQGTPKCPRKIDNTDGMEKEIAAVEEGVQVDMHVFTKTNLSIKEVKSKSKIKIKRSKGTPPSSVTKTGTYFRLINVYFDQIHSDDVAKLGGVPTVAELDCPQFLHKDVYDSLLATYSDINNNNIGWLAVQHKYFDNMGESRDIAQNFDADVTSFELKLIKDYNNLYYQIAH